MPRCNGTGSYLTHYARGYYHDGSFGHNQWEECTCFADMDVKDLPDPVQPTGDQF